MLTNDNRILLLALRTRTVRGIRSDFGGLYKMCPLGCGEIDNLENILSCRVIRHHHTSNEISQSDIKYQDVFSTDISKQQKVTEMYNQLLEIRNNILQSTPVASSTGPMHGDQAMQNHSILSLFDYYS